MSSTVFLPERDPARWDQLIFPALRAALASGYFQLEVEGAHHVPTDGPLVFVGNHSGWFALDGMMFNLALHDRVSPDRLIWGVVQDILLKAPGLRQFFAPLGVIPASVMRRPERLPKDIETFGTFPEGVAGICKPFWKAYQMTPWRSGFVRLALLREAQVVPCALIGGEECLPSIGSIRQLESILGASVPIPLVPAPLPTSWKIVFGKPMKIDGSPAAAHDLPHCRRQATAVQAIVQEMLNERTAHRPIRQLARVVTRLQQRWSPPRVRALQLG